ncbi:MAG: double zinc ribbon domain-containing protein [Bacteroidales bacterium]|jgi:ComF family protein|nr:double zinc ribbon domain-containing protein [Bacteroidales bacterium]MDD4430108.1 double zinc ribbon domain-containing protein [Bacteroidales bacterium]
MPGFIKELLNLLYPPLCVVCGRKLIAGEEQLCSACLYALPRTRFHAERQNPVCDRLFGKVPFEKATAIFYYQKESYMQCVMESFKYKSNRQLAFYLGTYAGMQLSKQGFFEQIDLILPVPLHKNKEKWRGYNQSELIARGLACRSGLPVDSSSLERLLENPTQTRRGLWERSQNVQQLFKLRSPDNLVGKHVLLVDDVLTSGSTMEACGNALLEARGLRLSFFALALA